MSEWEIVEEVKENASIKVIGVGGGGGIPSVLGILKSPGGISSSSCVAFRIVVLILLNDSKI